MHWSKLPEEVLRVQAKYRAGSPSLLHPPKKKIAALVPVYDLPMIVVHQLPFLREMLSSKFTLTEILHRST